MVILNLKNLYSLSIFVFILILSVGVSANNTCYMDATIGVQQLASEDYAYSLVSLENYYGDYSDFLEEYVGSGEGPCFLETFSSSGSLGKYKFTRNNFRQNEYYDEVSEGLTSSIEIIPYSTVSLIIPTNSEISLMKINCNGTYYDLNFTPSLMTCEKNCLVDGESGVYDVDYCCEGAIENYVQGSENSFVCKAVKEGACESGKCTLSEEKDSPPSVGLFGLNSEKSPSVLDLIFVQVAGFFTSVFSIFS